MRGGKRRRLSDTFKERLRLWRVLRPQSAKLVRVCTTANYPSCGVRPRSPAQSTLTRRRHVGSSQIWLREEYPCANEQPSLRAQCRSFITVVATSP
jgi:hypothetical protein